MRGVILRLPSSVPSWKRTWKEVARTFLSRSITSSVVKDPGTMSSPKSFLSPGRSVLSFPRTCSHLAFLCVKTCALIAIICWRERLFADPRNFAA